MKRLYSVFTGTGSYVPTKQIKNDYFSTMCFMTRREKNCRFLTRR